MSEQWQRRIVTIATFAVFFIVWGIGSTSVDNTVLLPSPKLVMDTVIEMAKGDLWQHLWASFRRVTLGVVIASGIAIPLALIMSRVKVIKWFVLTFTNFLGYAPITAFSFLMILFFGIFELPKVILISLAAFLQFLPIALNIYVDMDKKILDMAQSEGYKGMRLIKNIIIPYTTPEILRNALNLYGIGWTYVVIAEATNTRLGLGHLIHIGGLRGNTKMAFTALVIIIVVNILVNKVGTALLHKAFHWRYGKGVK